MAKAETYFSANISNLPKGVGGHAQDPHTANTQWGLYEMAKQLEAIQAQQTTLLRSIAEVERKLSGLR